VTSPPSFVRHKAQSQIIRPSNPVSDHLAADQTA